MAACILQPPVALWLESPCIAPGPIQHSISAQLTAQQAHGQPQAPLFSFTLQAVGGSAALGDSKGSLLSWQVENGSAGVLTLSLFSPSTVPDAPVSITFSQQLYPGVAVVQQQGRTSVVGLTGELIWICFGMAPPFTGHCIFMCTATLLLCMNVLQAMAAFSAWTLI